MIVWVGYTTITTISHHNKNDDDYSDDIHRINRLRLLRDLYLVGCLLLNYKHRHIDCSPLMQSDIHTKFEGKHLDVCNTI